MMTSFLSKFTRFSATAHNLNFNKNNANLHAACKPLVSLMVKKSPKTFNCDILYTVKQTGLNYFPRRYFSSSGSDGGDKGEGTKQKPASVLYVNNEESLRDPSISRGVPPPACASLSQDYTATPLEEHKIGLDLTRRGRSKPPVSDGSVVRQSPPKKDKKSKKQKQPDPSKPAPPPVQSMSNSRTRARDRLEILTSKDCNRRLMFAIKLLLLIEDEPEILDNILWTDECNFNLPKLSSLITKPPIAESELLPQIAWCGISTKGTVGPYFFNSHVTDKSYLKMLKDYFIPELERKGYNLNELWFQQDGAPWHRSQAVLDFLTSVFGYRIISLGTKFIWPPRSQDLTPMDYFFWDYMKVKLDFKHSKYDLCFQKSFREILTREVSTSSLNALHGAIYQLPERLEMCLSEEGGRFVHLLYPDRYEKDGSRKPRKPGDDLTSLKRSSKQTCSTTVTRAIDTICSSNTLDNAENESLGVINETSPSPIPPLPTGDKPRGSNNNTNLTP